MSQDQAAPQAPQAPSAPVVTEEAVVIPAPEEVLVQDAVVETVEEKAEEQIEFVKKVLPSEKIHYENIIAANKKTIASLREENIKLHSELKELKKE